MFRKIFVGGLSWETNEEDLRKYFSGFGLVKSCIIKLDRYTSHSRGFGFVIFDSEDTVNKVLEIKEHVLNKKKIDPKKAKPSREPQKKIFVGGLDPDLSEAMIKNYFSQFGEIENIESPFDTRKNKRKAYLFITFSNEIEARKATAQESQEIDGKKFEVRIAIPREQANRRWKGTNSNMFYPYAMLPYIYPEFFYSYVYNNPNLYSAFYNPYELLNYDAVNLSRQFSTGVMINNNPSNSSNVAAAAAVASTVTRPKITPNSNSSSSNLNGGQSTTNNSNSGIGSINNTGTGNISKRPNATTVTTGTSATANPFVSNIDRNHQHQQQQSVNLINPSPSSSSILPNGGDLCLSQLSSQSPTATTTSVEQKPDAMSKLETEAVKTNQNILAGKPNDSSSKAAAPVTNSNTTNNNNNDVNSAIPSNQNNNSNK